MERLGGKALDERLVEAGYRGKDGRESFARLVGVSRRTLEGWVSSNGAVPDPKVKRVQMALAGELQPFGPWQNLYEMSDLALIAHLQHVVAVVAVRLGESSLSPHTDGLASGRSNDSEGQPPVSVDGAIDGDMGMPPR